MKTIKNIAYNKWDKIARKQSGLGARYPLGPLPRCYALNGYVK